MKITDNIKIVTSDVVPCGIAFLTTIPDLDNKILQLAVDSILDNPSRLEELIDSRKIAVIKFENEQ